LTVGGLNTSTTYAGIISGTGGFIKTGTGTQTFTSVQTYTGSTTISAGTLALTGSGSINNSSELAIAVGSGTHGLFTTAGQLTFTNSLKLNLTGTLAGLVGSHDLINFGSAASGDFSSVSLTGITTGSLSLSSADTWTGTFGGYDFTFTETDGVLNVALAAIPEPSTYSALAGAFVLSLAVFRSRKRS
ncbi:MAG TPA: autotransporter-associated beta strand repeat-containing protein, partial [Rariglobus sp.]